MSLDPDNSAKVIAEMIAEVRTRLPSPDELTTHLDAGTMGPDVTLPAVWVRIILDSHDTIEAQAWRADVMFGALLAKATNTSAFNRAYAVKAAAREIVASIVPDDCPLDVQRSLVDRVARRIYQIPAPGAEA